MTPLVTCVLTCFDYAHFVDRAVGSALCQAGLPDGAVEVIAVDDGSTDGSLERLRAWGPPVTVLQQDRLGPAVATTTAIAAARGRYVALLDADDEWRPDKLARQLEVLARRPSVGLVFSDMEVVDGDGRRLQASNFRWTRQVPAVGRALGRFLAANQATTSTIVLRTELARAMPPPPDWAWCRDWWLAAHVAAAYELDCVPAPLTRYRLHGSNLSALSTDEQERTRRLWTRDLRVRRHLLRRLDLGSVGAGELVVAWARFTHFARQVGGLPEPVTGADRDEAAGLVAQARALLDADPDPAARAAVAALAADPDRGDAAELLVAARDRAAPPPPPSGPAHADRLRVLRAVRARLAEATTVPEAAELLREGDLLEAALRAEGTPAAALPAPGAAAREAALDAVEAALDEPAPAGAGLHAVRALGHDPADAHARQILDDALHRAAGREPPRSPGDPAPAARAPELAEARAFVALAWADELAADPALLRAWGRAIDGGDDATLVILAPGRAEADVAAMLPPLLAAAGVAEHDLQAIAAPPDPALDARLARSAHALLTRRPAPGPFGGLPAAASPEALLGRAERRWSFDGLGRPLSVAIKICPQRWDGAEHWGDLHVARALAADLHRRGHRALVQVVQEWDDEAGRACDVALHLRGLWPYVPRPGQLNVLWNISHPELVTPAECDRFDLVLTASPRGPERIGALTRTPVRVLEQATDPVAFFPDRAPAHEHDLVFVGNARGVDRPALAGLLPTRHDLVVWGKDWERLPAAPHVAGPYLPNDEVRRAYSSARVVLNDHWDDMREHGFVSNRVYDVLACGGLLLSDDLPELRERFGDAVVTFADAPSLRAAVDGLLRDPARRAGIAARGRELVLREHTWTHRVDALLAAVRDRLATPVA